MVAVGESERDAMVRVSKEEGWFDLAMKLGMDAGYDDPVVLIVAKDAIDLLPKTMLGVGMKQAEKMFRIQKRIGSPLFAVLTVEFSLVEKIYENDKETLDSLRRATSDIVICLMPDGVVVGTI